MRDIWRIIHTTSSLWRYYIAISLLTVGLAALNLLQPMLTGLAVDAVRSGTSTRIHYVVMLGLVIFAADIAANVFGNISGFLGDQMSVRVHRILTTRYYEHLLNLPQQYYDTELTGKIVNRLNRSITQISNFMNILSNNFLQFIFSTLLALVVVGQYSWQVMLMLALLYPLYFGLTIGASKKWKFHQAEKNSNLDIASGRFMEAIGQIRVVKSFNQEKYELGFFRSYLNRYVGANRPQSTHWHKWDIGRRFILSIIFLGVFLFIFIQTAHGHFTPGQAVALVLYAMQIRTPLFTISFLVNSTQRTIADSKDYFRVMNMPVGVTDILDAKELVVTKGKIEFNNVTFGYSKDRIVLENINLSVSPKTKIALVGESGEGKTTLTSLLLRLYDINAGRILVDGQDISRVSQASLRRAIGVVFQEPVLFSGTIRENISYGCPEASDDQITEAAKAANAHDFISVFDDGYDTEIGEKGLKLSGGQKQRIAIARAILKNAPILILDEATSSLDTKSEHMVQQALARLMKNRTTIIIAHRLSTIQHVDTIVTLKNGNIDEIGSPTSLASSGGIYSKLLHMQHEALAHHETAGDDFRKFDIASD